MFVATRIAEGCGKGTDPDFAVELKRARATGYELEYLLLVARDPSLLGEGVHDELAGELVEIRKMIPGLLNKLKSSP